VGQDELFHPRPVSQRTSSFAEVNPGYTEEEAKEYVDHRLRVVGASASQVFTPEALSMICLRGNGIPRTINILCDNALLNGYALDLKIVSRKAVREAAKDLGVEKQLSRVTATRSPIRRSRV
jgi:type II secretory pathway predicted ATPase ExeA